MADNLEDSNINQDEIGAVLAAAGLTPDAGAPPAPSVEPDANSAAQPTDAPSPAEAGAVADAGHDNKEVPAQASADAGPEPVEDSGAVDTATGTLAKQAVPFSIPELQAADAGQNQIQGIDLLRDVELDVKIELGRSRMLIDDVLRLNEGSVVELDKLAGDPVDVFVNDRLVARGEVLVLNDNFCVRINDILKETADEEG